MYSYRDTGERQVSPNMSVHPQKYIEAAKLTYWSQKTAPWRQLVAGSNNCKSARKNKK